MTLSELKCLVAEILEEAKKKAPAEIKKKGRSIEAYGLYDEAFDFAAPLGALSLYRQQGAVNWGPHTSDGPYIDSTFHDPQPGRIVVRESEERALRMLVREVIENGLVPASSAWAPMVEGNREAVYESPWEAAEPLFEAWYDKFKGSKKSEKASKKDEGHIGFSKLKGKLSHKSGVNDPGALAASIGRKKYGAAGMAKKSAAGRKK